MSKKKKVKVDPLSELTDDHCRFVIGDTDGEWHYCRAPRARHPDGQYKRWKWCDAHRAVVVVKATPWKPRAKPEKVNHGDRILDVEAA